MLRYFVPGYLPVGQMLPRRNRRNPSLAKAPTRILIGSPPRALTTRSHTRLCAVDFAGWSMNQRVFASDPTWPVFAVPVDDALLAESLVRALLEEALLEEAPLASALLPGAPFVCAPPPQMSSCFCPKQIGTLDPDRLT